MKALTIKHSEIIATHDGRRHSWCMDRHQDSGVFIVSFWLEGIEDGVRTGRPSQFDNAMEKGLDKALSKSPKEFGIQRVRWDGVVVAEYLKRFHGIEIHMRQAQIWLRNLGYSLRKPIYRYVQAIKEGVNEFHKGLLIYG